MRTAGNTKGRAGRRVGALAVGIAACTAGAGEPTAADVAAAMKVVEESQEAGYQRGDVLAYMGGFHRGAVSIMARGPEAASTDIRLTYEQLDATRRVRFCKLGARAELRLTLTGSRRKGDDLILEVDTAAPTSGELNHEQFVMRKIDGRWGIVENRYWIERLGPPQDPMTLDAKHWRDLSDAVQQDLLRGDRVGAFYKAMAGFDLRRAVAIANGFTAMDRADDDLMQSYAHALLFTGDAVGAVRLFERAPEMADEAVRHKIAAYCESGSESGSNSSSNSNSNSGSPAGSGERDP